MKAGTSKRSRKDEGGWAAPFPPRTLPPLHSSCALAVGPPDLWWLSGGYLMISGGYLGAI
eukprot:1720557-Pyramimonas_sp.AAC.1